MKVVNICGGPGIGKSTVAAMLFVQMKLLGLNVELVNEYAKELVWDNRSNVLDDQLYILAKQNRKLLRLSKSVDYVITDSPLFLGMYYGKDNTTKAFKSLVLETFKQYDNYNIFLPRLAKENYSEIGRLQNYEQAVSIDWSLECILIENNIPYINVKQEHFDKPDVNTMLMSRKLVDLVMK